MHISIYVLSSPLFFLYSGAKSLISAIDVGLGLMDSQDTDERESALEALSGIGSCKYFLGLYLLDSSVSVEYGYLSNVITFSCFNFFIHLGGHTPIPVSKHVSDSGTPRKTQDGE